MTTLKAIISFEEWRERNPDLENWVECPHCFGFGDIPQDEEEVDCFACGGLGDVNDLRSLYEDDVEHDLRLIFAVYPPNKITPGLKAFLDRFHVDGVDK
jgi:hypothetical protein